MRGQLEVFRHVRDSQECSDLFAALFFETLDALEVSGKSGARPPLPSPTVNSNEIRDEKATVPLRMGRRGE